MLFRLLVAAFMAFSASTVARAAIFDVGTGISTNVYGNFDAYGGWISGNVNLIISSVDLPPYDWDDPSTFAWWHVGVYGSGFVNIDINACNEWDAHCGRADRSENFLIVEGQDGVGSFYLSGFAEGNVSPPSFDIQVDLPDGFSLSPPVPEMPTWTMMLLGFAGATLVARRRMRAI